MSQEDTIRTSGLEGWKATVEIASFGGSKSSYSAAMGDVFAWSSYAWLLKKREGCAVWKKNTKAGRADPKKWLGEFGWLGWDII